MKSGKSTGKKTPAKQKAKNHNQQIKQNQGNSGGTSMESTEVILSSLGNSTISRLAESGVLQTKLNINVPGDMFERQADKAAEQVMKSGANNNLSPKLNTIQAKGNKTGGKVSHETEAGIKNLKGKGSALNRSTRDYFEPRYGKDLGNVRIHTGNNAGKLAESVNARAFTTGNDIVFNKGEYQPDTKEGKKLIAHELAHTIQQGGEIQLKAKGKEPPVEKETKPKDSKSEGEKGAKGAKQEKAPAEQISITNIRFADHPKKGFFRCAIDLSGTIGKPGSPVGSGGTFVIKLPGTSAAESLPGVFPVKKGGIAAIKVNEHKDGSTSITVEAETGNDFQFYRSGPGMKNTIFYDFAHVEKGAGEQKGKEPGEQQGKEPGEQQGKGPGGQNGKGPGKQGEGPAAPGKKNTKSPALIEAEKAQQMLFLSIRVYGEKVPPGSKDWVVAAEEANALGIVLDHPASGFSSQLYKNIKTNKYVYALEGTDPSEIADIATNLLQGVGEETIQYKLAMINTLKIVRKFGKDSVQLTGHSLGGALAASAATVAGVKATTFNAAGVHPATLKEGNKTREDAKELVTNYYVPGEILTYLQEKIDRMPKALGKQKALPYTKFKPKKIKEPTPKLNLIKYWMEEKKYAEETLKELKRIAEERTDRHLVDALEKAMNKKLKAVKESIEKNNNVAKKAR